MVARRHPDDPLRRSDGIARLNRLRTGQRQVEKHLVELSVQGSNLCGPTNFRG